MQQRLNVAQEELAEHFRFSRFQTEATVVLPNAARSAANDRELYAAISLARGRAKQLGQKRDIDEALAVFRNSLRQLDVGARNVLGSVSAIRIVENSNTELSDLQKGPAHCAIADGDQPSQPLIGKEPGALGIDLRSQDAGSVKTSAMFPIWRAPDGRVVPINSANFAGQPAPFGALVCLSDDANWLLTWLVQSDRHQSADAGVQPPYIQRIVWIRTGPIANRDNQWHAELTDHVSREPRSPMKILLRAMNPSTGTIHACMKR